jgi:aminobenzoyl-glutamate utilization protein A
MNDALLQSQLSAAAQGMSQRLVETRRALHRIPEPGFCEFRTAAYVIERLHSLGWTVVFGEEAMDGDAVHFLSRELVEEWFHAAAPDVDGDLLGRMAGGRTAIVASRTFGDGPTIAFRFDIDALPITESADHEHRPSREQFRSAHNGWMHACGHDGHVTLGLGLAELLAGMTSPLAGTVKLIFQPAEEGARGGANAIVEKGHLDDVDLLVCTHLGLNADTTGKVVCGTTFMGTFKYRARFVGRPAHVVLAPEDGRNALLAAATAALGLHSIGAHSDGWYNLNVGVMTAGTEQGVTPADATIDFGAWFDSPDAQEHVRSRALDVLSACARAQGCSVEVTHTGEAPYVEADAALAAELARLAERLPSVREVVPVEVCRAGEYATVLLDRVRSRGGRAAYVLVGAQLASGHHTDRFDFDEDALAHGVALLAGIAAGARELVT